MVKEWLTRYFGGDGEYECHDDMDGEDKHGSWQRQPPIFATRHRVYLYSNQDAVSTIN